MELIIAFVVGLVVMDLFWAWRMGVIQMLWARWKYRRTRKNPDYSEWSED